MARRKKSEAGGIKNEWINTFADLMNLLLCFFVLLFALSTVDGEKFEKVSISMANSIGVFDAGSTSLGTQELISGGMTQLSELDEFFSSMGKTIEGEEDPSQVKNTEPGMQGSSGAEGVIDDKDSSDGIQGANGAETENSSSDVDVEEALETIEEEKAEMSSDMYDQVSDLSDKYNLGYYVELSIDPEFRFVQLTLSGSILFESGSAEIIQNAKPVLLKVGDILKAYEDYHIEITGHTDNVPMSSSQVYKDNNWLSSARALNTADFLIKECDLDPTMIKYSGRGEYEPISSNATAEGRARNRRIEIKIYNEYSGG